MIGDISCLQEKVCEKERVLTEIISACTSLESLKSFDIASGDAQQYESTRVRYTPYNSVNKDNRVSLENTNLNTKVTATAVPVRHFTMIFTALIQNLFHPSPSSPEIPSDAATHWFTSV